MTLIEDVILRQAKACGTVGLTLLGLSNSGLGLSGFKDPKALSIFRVLSCLGCPGTLELPKIRTNKRGAP